jgi:tetrahydromethanopterin S-methyltransferase subunit G
MKSLIESLHQDFPLEEENTTNAIEPVVTNPKKPFVKSYDYDNKLDEMMNRLIGMNLTEAKYSDFKNDQSNPTKVKINKHINEIDKRLREVEQMITHAAKLKLESGADQTVFWKGTLGNFQKIDQRLNRLSNKIREMNT